MEISRVDAAQALAEIRRTEARGVDTRIYRIGGSCLILWGGVWAAAYTATGVLPVQDWWLAWLPGNLVGALGTLWLYRQGACKPGATAGLIVLAAACLVCALYAIDPPRTVQQADALPALLVGFSYMVLGAARLRRYVAIGGVVIAATVFGYFVLPGGLAFWMAAVGGAALVVGGLWLRSA